MLRISILSKRFGIFMSCSSVVEAAARKAISNWSMRSAAEFAISRTGIDCTSPKHAPTTNMRAVVVLVRDAPPRVSLNWGAANTTAPSKTYMATCDVTISLKVSAWLRILMLAAVRDTLTESSNKSLLRARLSLTSLDPSMKSVSRSYNRRSHSADSRFSTIRRRFLTWNIAAAPETITTVMANAANDKYAT